MKEASIMGETVASRQPRTSFIGILQELLTLLYGEEPVSELFQKFGIESIKIVVDTNNFLTDLKYSIQKTRITALIEAARMGGVRLFASKTVRDEVIEKIPFFMSNYGIDPVEAQQLWNTEYAPFITFLDPSELPPLSENVVTLLTRDPDDVQTGQIIELLRPHLVLSRDKDLEAFNITRKDSSLIVCAYRDKARKDVTTLGISIGGNLVVWVTSETVKTLISLVSTIDKRLAFGLMLLAAATLGFAALHPPLQQWLRERSLLSIKKLWVGLSPILDELMVIEEASTKAMPVISSSQRSVTPLKTARDYIAYVLSNSVSSLSVQEITRQMIARGYETNSELPERYISRILHKYPNLFEKLEGGHWHFKSHLFDTFEEAM